MRIIVDFLSLDISISALFQFLLNSLIQKQMQEQARAFAESSANQASDLTEKHPAEIVFLQSQLTKLKETRKQLQSHLMQAQNSQTESSKGSAELRAKVSTLTLQAETLQHDNDLMHVKLQVAQNELDIKSKEAESLVQSQIMDGDPNLEQVLRMKSEECQQLSEILRKQPQNLEELLKKQIADLHVEVAALAEESFAKQKRLKKGFRSMKT